MYNTGLDITIQCEEKLNMNTAVRNPQPIGERGERALRRCPILDLVLQDPGMLGNFR